MRRRIRLRRPVPGGSPEAADLLGSPERIATRASSVTAATVLEREGDVSILELEIRGRTAPLVLEVVRLDRRRMQFSQVDRVGRHAVEGEVSVVGDGPGECWVEVAFRYPMTWWGRPRAGDVRHEVETALAPHPEPAGGDAASLSGVILEIRPGSHPGELVAEIHGRRYRLREEP